MPFQQYPFKGGIPSGNTANRPGSPTIGDTYYNGELGLLEIYTVNGWQPSSAPSGTPAITVTDLGTSRAYTDGPAFKIDFTPSSLGGFATGYTVTATTTVTSSVYTGITSTGSTITVATFSGATGYGASYTVNGASYNGFGASPYQNGGVTVTTKPETPTIGTATIPSFSSSDVLVTWTNGANGGLPLSSIKVRAYSGATLISTTTAATTSSTSATVTGLSSGTTYTFKVFSTNANGDSPESSATNSVKPLSDISALVVAGGGGGGNIISGGGGAGGFRNLTSLSVESGKAYTLTVGAGGRGGTGYSDTGANEAGYPGWNSVFGLVSASGGGGAPGWSGDGSQTFSGQRPWSKNGGSGAGGTSSTGGTGNLGGYSPVEGYAGGTGGDPLGAGGGGASEAGVGISSTANTRSGGNGAATTITGTSVTYAGGGGGGRRRSGGGDGPSLGGSGGGGRGMSAGDFSTDQNGSANTGGGGGGGNYIGPSTGSQAAGNGGSGIVIIKIPNTLSASFSGGVTSSLSTSVSGYKVYTITAAGTSDTVTIS